MNDDVRLENYGRTICRMLGYDPDAVNTQGVPRWRIFEDVAEEVMKIADKEIHDRGEDEYHHGLDDGRQSLLNEQNGHTYD